MNYYLFLDIDGVLNSHHYFFDGKKRDSGEAHGSVFWLRDQIDPLAVAHLNAIVAASDARIVISSSWRQAFPLSKIANALYRRGFLFHKNIVGKTGYRADGDKTNRRGLEIQDWLDAEHSVNDEPRRFVILDDSRDMGKLMPYLVLTTWDQGLLAEHVEPALRILRGE